MKALSQLLAVITFSALFLVPGLTRAQDYTDENQNPPDDQGVSFQVFYDQLADQGTWIQTDDYGYVFQPNVEDPNWAPYTEGHWVDTDQGWAWVSDEPWGWATYHYGRWANIDGTGWVWVPGYRWAPAWVSWRYGHGYAGWAPLPPESLEGSEYGDEVADFGDDVDVNFHIGAGCYNFIEIGFLGEPSYRGHFVDRDRNYGIINRTNNITHIDLAFNSANGGGRGRGFGGVNSGGPQLSAVNAVSKHHVQTVSLTAANKPGRSTVQGNKLAVFAPTVNPASAKQARPGKVGGTVDHPKFNRGDSVTNPLAVNNRVHAAAPNAAAVQAAQQAQAQAPATAKIATAQTPIKTALTAPLTSQQPITHGHNNPANGATQPNGGNPNGFHPQATAPTPGPQPSAATAPFTGEPVTPQVHQPQAQQQPQTGQPQVHQPQIQQHQPQAEATPAQQVQHQQQEQAQQAHQQQLEAQQARQQQQQQAQGQQAHQPQLQQQAQAQQEQAQQVHHQQQAEAQQAHQQQLQQAQAQQAHQQQAEAQQPHQQQQQERPQPQAQAPPQFHQPQPQAQPHPQPQAQPHPQPQAQPQPQPQAAPQGQPSPGGPGGGGGNKHGDKDKPGQ